MIKTASIFIDAGGKISKFFGVKYEVLSKDIANNIKGFQGKRIRSFEEAMKSLNKITANPGMKINQVDKNAIINAWKQINAKDMAYKFGFLGKAFSFADVLMRVEKIREKSIQGYETGNWGPLVREVESWVLSGMIAGIAMGIMLASVASGVAAVFGLPVSVVTILGIIGIALVASMIDDKLVGKINNELIRPAH